MTAMLAEVTLGCRDDPELFYPLSAISVVGRDQIRRAKAICGRCPVQARCLEEVLTWPKGQREVGMVAGGQFFRAGSDQYERSRNKGWKPSGRPA